MRKIILFISLFLFINIDSNAQVTKDYAVPIQAIINASDPSITLYWTATSATNFSLYRKLETANTWTVLATGIAGTTRSYTDTNVLVNTKYEYKITKNASGYNGYGYIVSGINIDLVEYRGTLILLMDSIVAGLGIDITNYIQSIEADGWKVKPLVVGRYEAVSSVKSKIINLYIEDPISTKTLFILGHVPVPYSGSFTVPPDGHTDHVAAWPTDSYYGDMDAIWDDISVNSTSGSDPRNRNIPGDGKFDYDTPPTDIELEIGRVDFYNLSYYSPITEFVLYQNYLRKDIKYRQAGFSMRAKGIIDDNFGTMSGEAFASSGWKSFAPIIGDSNIIEDDIQTRCSSESFMYSYGCGPGSYESCGGVITSGTLSTDSLRTVINMLFGSYFGDWDSPNNLMRSMIAQGTALTTCWSGRPHWYLHHLALGENIGYSQRRVQNNTGMYYSSSFDNGIQIALMGDPTVRAHMIVPPKNVRATYLNPQVLIQWDTILNEGILGYKVYKKNEAGIYEAISPLIVNNNRYYYTCVTDIGIDTFIVKSIRLETSASGTYYNSSVGMGDTAWINQVDTFTGTIYSTIHSSTGVVDLYASSSLVPNSYIWDFGDGQSGSDSFMQHSYAHSGTYTIQLIVSNGCLSDTIYKSVSFIIDQVDNLTLNDIQIYPNPTSSKISIICYEPIDQVILFDLQGNKVLEGNEAILDIEKAATGTYVLKIVMRNGTSLYRKICKI
ncbi:MAG: PKD domain-containing protein [Bacteroidota bacterium]